MAKQPMGIYLGRDFVIMEKNADGEAVIKRTKTAKCAAVFADIRADKQGSIAYIYDIYGVDQKDLDALAKDARFLERRHFTAINLFKNGEVMAEFEGSMIDALEFVTNNLDELRNKYD